MKGQLETVLKHLEHALIFIQEAKLTEYPELRAQQLDEAERLVEYAKGVMEHGETQRG